MSICQVSPLQPISKIHDAVNARAVYQKRNQHCVIIDDGNLTDLYLHETRDCHFKPALCNFGNQLYTQLKHI